MIGAALGQVNGVLAGAGVAIGSPGEPAWAPDGAYGSDWDVRIRGHSLAALRFALTQDGRLMVAVTARDPALVRHLDASASIALDGASPGAISELLSKCIRPAAAYAPRFEPPSKPVTGPALDRISMAALKAGSGALSLAGARLVPLAPPAWEPNHRVHRLPVAIQMFGSDIARMHIDRGESEIEVAVGLPDRSLVNLGRRERIPLGEVTTHTLAEAIASCAWPVIASYQGPPRQPVPRHHQR